MKRIILFLWLIVGSFAICESQTIIRANPFARAVVTSSPAGPEQNLILHSEAINNWSTYPAMTVTQNTENDLNGAATLDSIHTPYNECWVYQNVTTNISGGTAYVLSFEVSGAADGDEVTAWCKDLNDNSIMLNTPYGSSVSGTVQRLSFEFTTDVSIPSGMQISIITNTAAAEPSSINIGRVHLYEGTTGDKSYVTTTTSQVP